MLHTYDFITFPYSLNHHHGEKRCTLRMLHELRAFQALVVNGDWCYLNERRPWRTRDKFGWTDDDVAAILRALQASDWQKTVLNCDVTESNGCESVDADQYLIFWDETEKKRQPKWSKSVVELSLKIAIFADCKGQAAGLVTFHNSGQP